ncbi:MAG: phosphatidylserine decarboxylase [Paludibacteraceae bacterium]|nr:phosphatidylserine decarboxylase [Paludibacteraceae bacterium]
MNPLIDNIDLRCLLEQSLAQAAVANPHRKTNPVRTIDQWLAYIESFAHLMPWQGMDIGEDASFFRRIDQNIGYFYFLLDQPLDALRDKGYIYPSLQYEPRVAAWLKDYNTAWGKWLSSPDSWNDSYYNIARTDARFELDTDRYESPDNWHSWNDFFARRLRSESRNYIMTGLRNFLSPSDGEIAFSPVKTASIANWLDLLGDSPYRECFAGGETTHIVLDVFDYHRFHAPCDGAVLECKTIEGIHAGGGVIIWDEAQGRYRYDQLGVTDFQMLETRGVLVMETPDFGKIALVAVGVQQVSSVVWTHPALADSESLNPNPLFAQGEELGLFKFGGSDVVLFFELGRAPRITPKSVKAGEKIA